MNCDYYSFISISTITALPLAAHFLISHLFQHSLFLVLAATFFTARVFLVGISFIFLEIIFYLVTSYVANISHVKRTFLNSLLNLCGRGPLLGF